MRLPRTLTAAEQRLLMSPENRRAIEDEESAARKDHTIPATTAEPIPNKADEMDQPIAASATRDECGEPSATETHADKTPKTVDPLADLFS